MFPGQLVRVTAETTTLVTAAEFKNHIREDLSDASNDTYITSLLSAATTWVEQFTCRTTINATYAYYLEQWPRTLYLPRPPISSITLIAYMDMGGASQGWASTNYEFEAYSGLLAPVYGKSFPAVRVKPRSISVAYVAGYGATASSVPEAFKLAVKQLAGHWYESRLAVGDARSEIPMACKHLLYPYRIKEFA
jgi:uncharacterized phiE125 gp8 family phage protein